MSFLKLPDISKRKIMRMLPLGSRYNLSLVWPGFDDEVKRSMLTVDDQMDRFKKSYINSENLDD